MIKLQVIGNLGKDCTVKEINGKNVINFSVAHTERYNSQGTQRERTTWVECAYWTDRTALAPYLLKGTILYVEGIPEADAYINKQNEAAATLRLKVSNLQFVGGGKSNLPTTGTQAAPAQSHAPAPSAATAPPDDLPF